jgi:hypothetical protein
MHLILSSHLSLSVPCGLLPNFYHITMRATCPYHILHLDLLILYNTRRTAQIIKLLILHFSQFPCYFLCLRPYHTQHLNTVLKHPKFSFSSIYIIVIMLMAMVVVMLVTVVLNSCSQLKGSSTSRERSELKRQKCKHKLNDTTSESNRRAVLGGAGVKAFWGGEGKSVLVINFMLTFLSVEFSSCDTKRRCLKYFYFFLFHFVLWM